jgi:hypothetical protein
MRGSSDEFPSKLCTHRRKILSRPLSDPPLILSILLTVQGLFGHLSFAGHHLLPKLTFSFDACNSIFLSCITAFSGIGPRQTASACTILAFEVLQAAFHTTGIRELAAMLSADLEQTGPRADRLGSAGAAHRHARDR